MTASATNRDASASGGSTGSEPVPVLHTPRSTLTIQQAEQIDWDVAVIGAGPGGSLAATMLAQRGLNTLLVDRAGFPRYKVCGACLNPFSRTILESCGLAEILDDAVPLRQMKLMSRGRTVEIPVTGSIALSRQALDSRLAVNAVQAGATFLDGVTARVRPVDRGTGLRVVPPSHRQVELRRPGEASAVISTRVVISADGLTHSSLADLDEFTTTVVSASHAGAGCVQTEVPAGLETGHIYMSVGTGGYVGMVRVEDGSVNIAAALSTREISRVGNVPSVADCIVKTAFGTTQPVPDVTSIAWHGTPLLTRSTTPLASSRIFLIGDSVGYIEPFTGQGIAWALASANAVVPLVQCACQRWDSLLERSWNDQWYAAVGRTQIWCRRLAGILRSPSVVSAAIRLMSACPWLVAPIAGSINRHHGSRGVVYGTAEETTVSDNIRERFS